MFFPHSFRPGKSSANGASNGGMISECGISGGCSDLLISDFVNSPLVVSDDVAVLDCLPFVVSRAAKFGFISSRNMRILIGRVAAATGMLWVNRQ